MCSSGYPLPGSTPTAIPWSEKSCSTPGWTTPHSHRLRPTTPGGSSCDGRRAPTLGEVVLNPTRIYCDPVVDLLDAARGEASFNIEHVRGICHITGGGLSNLLRLHPSLGWDIHSPLPVLPEFAWLQAAGGVETREMYRTFNMGMGMVVAVDASHADTILAWLQGRMEGVAVVGHVRDHGHRVTHALEGVEFSHY